MKQTTTVNNRIQRVSLSKEEYDRLRKRLYASIDALRSALRTCPDLERYSVPLEDGHQLLPDEIIRWLDLARDDWRTFAPAEVKRRKLNEMVRDLSQNKQSN